MHWTGRVCDAIIAFFSPYLEVMLNSVKNPEVLQFFCPVEGIGGEGVGEHICILIVLC